MKKFKKIVALATAMAMAMAPTVVSAAKEVSTGSAVTGGATDSEGEFEGWIEKSVFSYELPTVSGNAFDFIIDPQNLIVESNDAMGKDVVTTGATGVYFKNGDGYAASSDALTIKNYSSMDVDVSIEASIKITSGDGVNLVTSGAVTNAISNEAASLDLSIAVNQVTTGAVEYVDQATSKAALTATMAALDADNFEITTSAGAYVYQPKADSTDVKEMQFYLTGSCNTAADWSSVDDMSTELDVVWTVARGGGAITASNKTVTWNRTSDLTFNVDLASFGKTSIEDIAIYYNNNIYGYNGSWGKTNLKDYDFASVDGNQITLKPGIANYLPSGATLFVRFNGYDSSVSKGDLQITVN